MYSGSTTSLEDKSSELIPYWEKEPAKPLVSQYAQYNSPA